MVIRCRLLLLQAAINAHAPYHVTLNMRSKIFTYLKSSTVIYTLSSDAVTMTG